VIDSDKASGHVSAAMLIAGGCTVSGQVLLLRELMAAFQGNELSLGGILAAWLLWGAAGSWMAGMLADRVQRPASLLAAAMAAGAVLLPATVFASGLVRMLCGASPTEMIGFGTFVWTSALVLGPLCLVQGGYFALGSKALWGSYGEASSGRAYLLESAGSAGGGLLLSLLLINLLPPVALALLLAAVMLLCAAALVPAGIAKRLGLVLLAAAAVAATADGRLDALRWRMVWRPMRSAESPEPLREARNSRYGSLAAVEVEGETSLYADGLLTATQGARRYAEELVHIGLAYHPGPSEVLLVGGGLSGSLAELLKYPVDHVHYVELDPAVIELGRRHFPEDDLRPLQDPKTIIHYIDARYFVKHTGSTFDAVIMHLPGPRSARLNRMYSREFFAEVKRVLRPNGILVFAVGGEAAYLSAEERLLLGSLYKTAESVFDCVRVVPADSILFVLSDAPLPEATAGLVMGKVESAGIDTQFVRWDKLEDELDPYKVAGLQAVLEESGGRARINRDFAPVGYLYDLTRWAAHFRSGALKRLLETVLEMDRWRFYALPAGALLLGGLLLLLARRRGVGLAVAVGGLSEMIFQLVVLIGFQVLYGYLFYRIGIMVGLFMAGLALGSLVVWRWGELSRYRANRCFLLVQGLICLYPLMLPLMLRLRPPAALFMLLPALAGVIGGAQLPLAVRMVREKRRGVGRSAGSLYGLDLFGSCFGALLAGPILIPAIGLEGICLWAAALNAVVLVILVARQ